MNVALSGGLLGLSLLLGIVLATEAAAPIAAIEVPSVHPENASATAQSLPPFNPPPQARFAEIAARPVFSPLRKPFPQTDLLAAQNTTPPQAKLIGVIISAQKSLAILKGPESGNASSVAIGQMFEGWQVSRIDPGQVVFHSAQGDYAIALHTPRVSGKTPAKTPGPGGDPL
ncbi:MAG TPA: hypothetical protein VGG10_05355 [Rhizomicrobium sp.]|jgi:hypothetical protein